MCREDDLDDYEMIDEEGSVSAKESNPINETLVENLEESVDSDTNIMKILVATDIHVGFGENKVNRYLDSVNTFEEVLKIATQKQVDMILLGGDLFHENNPSRDMQHKVVQLLRQYCLSDREVALEFLSDASTNFSHSRFGRVNYEDCNLNIGLPIFTIHGNHDDMAGKGLTALDLLHESGLVNLFGKFEDVNQYEVTPILLRKGSTRVALFGIGSQRDDRLCRAFAGQSIKFLRPRAGHDEWFNLLTIHQNRPRRSTFRSTGAFLPEQYIPSFFDLVVWGHEHECKPNCQYISSSDAVGDGFYVLQPGSTIATSLTKEEAIQKHVFLVKIRGRKFQCKPIPLQTTRQLIVDELVLDKLPCSVRLPANGIRPAGEGFILDEMLVKDKIEEMIKIAAENRKPQQPELPIIRLKVIYAGPWANLQPINGRRIGAKFDDRVANATDMIVTKTISGEKKMKKLGSSQLSDPLGTISAASLDQVISQYFDSKPWEERLTVLTHGAIGEVVEAFAEDDSISAVKANQEFKLAMENRVEDVKSKLKQMPVPELYRSGDGHMTFNRFEMIVRNDLNQLKKLVYKAFDDAETGQKEEDSLILDNH